MQSDTTEYEIYVDGAFRSNLVGYGVVILKSGTFTLRFLALLRPMLSIGKSAAKLQP